MYVGATDTGVANLDAEVIWTAIAVWHVSWWMWVAVVESLRR